MSHLDLPRRMREAAATIREVNALYSYQSEFGLWNARSLEHEADVVESEVPR